MGEKSYFVNQNSRRGSRAKFIFSPQAALIQKWLRGIVNFNFISMHNYGMIKVQDLGKPQSVAACYFVRVRFYGFATGIPALKKAPSPWTEHSVPCLVYVLSEVLALKHKSRILRQWADPVSGSRKSQASSPWVKQHRVYPIPSWRNHILI